MRSAFALLFIVAVGVAHSDSVYFPPEQDTGWETISPESLGWDVDALDELLDWLGEKETRAFIMTTGLDYTVADQSCTLPECLAYRADAGKQW